MKFAKDVKLIAMDMDGTLLDSHKRVSDENLAALREAHARGIHLAICSGRMPGDIGLYAQENGLENCTLLSINGAYCLHALGEEPFVNQCLSEQAVQSIMQILKREKITFICVAQNHRVHFEYNHIQWDLSYLHNGHPQAPVVLHGQQGFEQIAPQGFNKLVCVSQNPRLLMEIRGELAQIPGVSITASGSTNLELTSDRCSKGAAVRALAEKLGLTPDEVMVFGDYLNDESMFAYAGWPVAMGNGCEELRRMAKLITLTNDESGVAWALRKYVL